MRLKQFWRYFAFVVSTISLAQILCYFIFKSLYFRAEIICFIVAILITVIVSFVQNRKPAVRTFSNRTFACLSVYLFLISFVGMTFRYGMNTFPLARYEEVIQTLQMPISGFSIIFIKDWLLTTVPVCLLFALTFPRVLQKFYCTFAYPKRFLALVFIGSMTLVFSYFVKVVSVEGAKQYAEFLLGMDGDFTLEHSDFLEKNFKTVTDADVSADSSTRNLVYIFVESLENSFQKYAAPLDSLAKNSLQFGLDSLSNFDGGFSTEGALNTVQSTIAKTSGIPVLLYSHRTLGYIGKFGDSFFDDVRSIYDVLRQFGYKNVFVQGTDSDFAKMRSFFLSHGIDTFYDNVHLESDQNAQSERESDVVMRVKYSAAWRDKFLFEKARQILDTLSKEPHFSLSIATIDTHFPHGFYDKNCLEKPKDGSNLEILKATIRCSSREVVDFVKWIEEQPFGNNTTVVIAGDHIFQGNLLVEKIPDAQRRWVDIFVHPSQKPLNRESRVLTSFDMAPTVLESMGFSLKDSRMGLGVSLFSNERTLAEKFGIDSLNAAIKNLKRSYEYNDLLFGKPREESPETKGER